MPIATHPMTYDELRELPNDGKRREIHHGELIVSPSPDWNHQKVISRFAFEVRICLADHNLPDDVVEAPLDVRLAPQNVYQPDVVYISPERRHLLQNRMPIDGAPDLLAEALSPSSRQYDQREKAQAYARAGVREYWLLDLEVRTIEVLTLRDGGFVIVPAVDGRGVSLVLPGFTVDPAALFADLD